MYRLNLLVLNVERPQKEFCHTDSFGLRRFTRDLRYDGFQELFPNDLRLDGFIEGTRSHFHLEPGECMFFMESNFGTYIFGAFSLHLDVLFDGLESIVYQHFGQWPTDLPFVKQ